MNLDAQTHRADEAERTKEQALKEKQAACDQRIESERKAQQESREALVQAHESTVHGLNAHLEMREKEHEKAITAVAESRLAMESALRQGYEKEIKAKEDLLQELQSYLKKADETLREAFGDASLKALCKSIREFLRACKNAI